ncbi:unnamed protein product, partial [Mesorhabditis belari]|uniref:DUF4440 domain-containing protein n=1 Tax=Mesorhabditis belari TaxID=2138241 RepID=A0AAF3EC47_9BILA
MSRIVLNALLLAVCLNGHMGSATSPAATLLPLVKITKVVTNQKLALAYLPEIIFLGLDRPMIPKMIVKTLNVTTTTVDPATTGPSTVAPVTEGMSRIVLSALLLAVSVNGHMGSATSPAATLLPLVKEYQRLIYDGDYEGLHELYHPHAVLVASNENKVLYKPKEIFKHIRESRKKIHNARSELAKETYSGDGGVLIYENRYLINDNGKDLYGPYRAIWIKYHGRYVIYHEEYDQRVNKKELNDDETKKDDGTDSDGEDDRQ